MKIPLGVNVQLSWIQDPNKWYVLTEQVFNVIMCLVSGSHGRAMVIYTLDPPIVLSKSSNGGIQGNCACLLVAPIVVQGDSCVNSTHG